MATLWEVLDQAARFRALGQAEQAAEIHRNIIETYPEFADAVQTLGDLADQVVILEGKAHRATAFELVDRCLSMFPDDTALLDHAARLVSEGAVEQAARRRAMV